MAETGPDLSGMLEKISQNPSAISMLSDILGGGSGKSDAAPPETAEESADPITREAGLQFASHRQFRHGKKRRDTLLALRPYLGIRRCAALDRMIRALELYEIIEETQLLKGRESNV